MNAIKIYTGVSVENKEEISLHPINAAILAKEIIDTYKLADQFEVKYITNDFNFISTMWHYGLQEGVDVMIYVDDKPSNIEGYCEDINRALDYLNEILDYNE